MPVSFFFFLEFLHLGINTNTYSCCLIFDAAVTFAVVSIVWIKNKLKTT